MQPTTLDNIFTRGRHNDDAVFQLLTYCLFYSDTVDASVGIQPVVYPFKTMITDNDIPVVNVEGKDIGDFRCIGEPFRARLADMISEIFSPDTVFDQADNEKSCKYCPFLDLCGRTEPKW